jgi:hypothetical protein
MLNPVYLIVCMFIFLGCQTQSDKSLIVNWKSYSIPTNPDTLEKYNHSSTEWMVFLKNDTVRVTDKIDPIVPSPPFPLKHNGRDKPSILKVEDGYLIGSYRGEWGGDLYWYSPDGKKNYKISDDEIVQFIKKDGENYAIQGLSHLGMSEGSIIAIKKEKNRWVAKQYLNLSAAPDGIVLDSHKNFIVITSKGLLKINRNLQTDTLTKKAIWFEMLYTNSLVMKNDVIYAGMRAGVYKYSLITSKQEWLQPY